MSFKAGDAVKLKTDPVTKYVVIDVSANGFSPFAALARADDPSKAHVGSWHYPDIELDPEEYDVAPEKPK